MTSTFEGHEAAEPPPASASREPKPEPEPELKPELNPETKPELKPEPLSVSDWIRLEEEMSFSRDSSHLHWQPKLPAGNSPQLKQEVKLSFRGFML